MIGDVHANASALAAALATADAAGYDLLVFLGDLLTYGADVAETVERVGERLRSGNVALLRGNHDAVYQDLLERGSAYADSLPAWIRESIDWTRERLPVEAWRALTFEDERTIGATLFSHASPFGPNRWQYLNSAVDHASAAEELRRRGLAVGVFGHTHRIKWYRHDGAAGTFLEATHGNLQDAAVHVLNAGAIGQPRDSLERLPCVLWLEYSDLHGPAAPARFSRQHFAYDVAEHLGRLERSGLPSASLARIIRFFAQ